MPSLTPLPNGMVEITYESGATYQATQENAEQMYPESFGQQFQDSGVDPGSSYQSADPVAAYPPQPEQPPWVGQQYDPSMGPSTIDNHMAQAQPQPAVEPPWVGEYADEEIVMEPDPIRPAPAPMQSARVSQSRSQSGTNPYQESGRTGLPQAPPTGDLEKAAMLAHAQRMSGIDETRKAAEAYDEGLGERYKELAQHRKDTAAGQAAMHEEARREVEAGESRLMQRVNEAQRMDMNKVWKDTSSSVKLVGILSAGIAGWLNPTGENSVVSQMMQIADQSAKEQAANMAQERWQIGQQGAALGRTEDRAQEDRKIYLEERAILESTVIDQIGLEKSKYSSAITLANLSTAEAAATEKYAGTVKELRDTNFNQSMSRQTAIMANEESKANRRQRAAQFSQSRADSQAAAALKALKDAKREAPPIFNETQTDTTLYPNPQIWGDMTPGDKEEFKIRLEAQHSAAEAIRNLDDAYNHWGEIYGGPLKGSDMSPDSDAYRDITAKVAAVIEKTAFAVGGKALTGPEMKIFTDKIGDMDTWMTGGDNSPRMAAMMTTLDNETKRLYGRVKAKSVVDAAHDTPWSPGDMAPHEPRYELQPYRGNEGQFRLNEPSESEQISLQQDIDLLNAEVEDAENAVGDASKAAAAFNVDKQYRSVLEKYGSGAYSADTADSTAKTVDEILGRLPSEMRPGGNLSTEWIGRAVEGAGGSTPRADVAGDFRSYGAESAGVRDAITAIRNDEELSAPQVTDEFAKKRYGSLEDFNKARVIMGMKPAMDTGIF